mmetsp:Transcript_37675/g.99558  ORF Transcript_37675/g.99558 Transcript_37675/m.99558 type:complete len:80 (-) Transcript_37675:728-967(-)
MTQQLGLCLGVAMELHIEQERAAIAPPKRDTLVPVAPRCKRIAIISSQSVRRHRLKAHGQQPWRWLAPACKGIDEDTPL